MHILDVVLVAVLAVNSVLIGALLSDLRAQRMKIDAATRVQADSLQALKKSHADLAWQVDDLEKSHHDLLRAHTAGAHLVAGELPDYARPSAPAAPRAAPVPERSS